MIFQASIDLDIPNKTVHAIIDFETGFIGFTESIGDETIEYYYGESPVEFKKSLINKLESSFAEKRLMNFKICRKNEKMREIGRLLS